MKGNLSNFELEDLARKHKIKLDLVISKDQLGDYIYELNRMKEFFLILNLQDLIADDGTMNGGTHWVSLAKVNDRVGSNERSSGLHPKGTRDEDGKYKFCYFDSYGFVPPVEVINLAKKLNIRDIIYNEKQIQKEGTEYCGYYSLLFLDYIQTYLYVKRNLSLKNIMKKFNDNYTYNTHDSDNRLKQMIRKYF